MNSSRKIMNQQDKEAKNGVTPAVPEKKVKKPGFLAGRELKPIILTALCVIVALVLCIGVAIQQLKPKVVATVGDTKFTMNDMLWPIFEVESVYLSYNEMYEMYMGTSVWDAAYQGSSGTAQAMGVTNSVGLKQEIIDKEVQYEILYQKAVAADYKLTEEEKKESDDAAKETLKGLSWIQTVQLNVSEKSLTKRFEKLALANRFKEDTQTELNKNVDEAETIKDIKKKDYRQYDVEYYYASTTTTDDEGNSVALTDAEKTELQKKMKEISKKGNAGEDFAKLISEDDETITFEEDTNFTEQNGFPYVSADNLKKIKKMENGTVSEAFIDDEKGYYVVIKMINNNSSEAYDNACDSAIQTAQDAEYQDWYLEEQQNYKIDINTDVWSDVVIGTVTTDIVTLEDIQRIAEEQEEESDKGSTAE